MSTSLVSQKKWKVNFILSIFIALYAFVIGISISFASIQNLLPPQLIPSFNLRPTIFIVHIVGGSIALITGSINISRIYLVKNRKMHKKLGWTYIISIWLSAPAGFVMAFYSAVGWVDHLGFALLAVTWFTTTTIALYKIRQRKVSAHREWILRSFAVTFAAVTLRLWNPLLIAIQIVVFKNYTTFFEISYPWVSFLAWVPNIVFIEYWIRRTRTKNLNVQDLI